MPLGQRLLSQAEGPNSGGRRMIPAFSRGLSGRTPAIPTLRRVPFGGPSVGRGPLRHPWFRLSTAAQATPDPAVQPPPVRCSDFRRLFDKIPLHEPGEFRRHQDARSATVSDTQAQPDRNVRIRGARHLRVGSRVDPSGTPLKDGQIAGPGWLDSESFDIFAIPPADTPKEEIPAMFQALLAERFQLRYHLLAENSLVYALIVGRGGPKVKESAAPDLGADQSETVKMTGGAEKKMLSGWVHGPFGPIKLTVANGTLTNEFSSVTMPGLAQYLTQLSDLPVVDRTELNGTYEVTLKQAVGARLVGVADDGTAEATVPGDSVQESLQRLGLRLVRRKLQLEKLVIDHIERPTAN